MDRTGESLHKLLAELKDKHCGNIGTEAFARQAAADEKRRWKERCRERGVPMPIWDLVAGGRDESGNRWRVTDAIKAIESQMEQKKRFLVLGGPPGSGKTKTKRFATPTASQKK